MSELIINKCYEVFFDRGSLKNPVIIKIKRIYKDINPWSNKKVDYIEAEAIDDNGIYYESISYPKNNAELFKPIDDCVLYSPDFMKIKQDLAFSKLLNLRLGSNSVLNQDVIQSILDTPRSVSSKTLIQKTGQKEKEENATIANYLNTLDQYGSGKRSKGGKRSKNKRSKNK